ncbi:MAG: hypothetical protein H0V17_33995 [Deltaproteobacteria bacterium]|nr:hypothetical protein [Deltaproteobacteria bacterium]
MKTLTKFAFALSLGATALTGCAADVDGTDPTDPTDPVDPPLPENVDAAGKYKVNSSFDLATNLPGKVGEVTNTFISMTDDPDDPSNYILDQLIANTSGTFKSILQGAKPFVAGYINDRILEIAPDFISTILAVGNDFGQVAKNFGLNETLEVSKAGEGWVAKHSVLGARFKIDGVEADYPFADYGTEPVIVESVGMSLESSGKLTLSDHTVGLAYGKVLRIALDGAIIPSLDPTATNLAQLLQHQVNCNVVGQAVNDAVVDTVGFGPGPGVFATACNLGLQKAADAIYGKLAGIDGSALELGLTGTAKALDKDGNGQIDTIQTGAWTGTASYAGTPAPLAGATFFGSRM